MRFFPIILTATAFTLSSCGWFSNDVSSGLEHELKRSWIYNEGTCNKSVVRETLYEFSFGDDLTPGTLNPIRTNSPGFKTSTLSEDDELVTAAKSLLGHCDGYGMPSGDVTYIIYDNVRNVKKFIFYKTEGFLYLLEENKVTPLINLSKLNALIAKEDPSIKESQ